jgi:predicted DNA repair protein MutK
VSISGKEQVVDGVAGELPNATTASSSSSVSNPAAAAAAVPEDAASNGTAAAAASGLAVVLDDSKSEISLVHELALKRDLPITFEVSDVRLFAYLRGY